MKTNLRQKSKRPKSRSKQSKRAADGAGVTAKLVGVPNTQFVRLPDAALKASGLPRDVEMIIQKGRITIQAKHETNEDWDAAFKRAIAANGPIPPLTEEERAFLEMPNDFEQKEWTW